MRKYIIFLIFNIQFLNSAIGQINQKDMILNYKEFMALNVFTNTDDIEDIYVFNDSTLVYPVLERDIMPMNGVVIQIPSWIDKFKNVKNLLFVGLYVTELPEQLNTLKLLETIKFSLPRNCNVEKIISDISKLKALKTLDLSDSVINIIQFEQLRKALPQIKIIDSAFLN